MNGDGTAPNFGHAPLYLLLVAAAQRAARHTGAGEGDREAVLVSLALFLSCVGATYLLARRLFGDRAFGSQASRLGALFFVFGGMAIGQSIRVHPALLAALLFTLLLLALWRMDTLVPLGEEPRRSSLPMAAVAGALCGLLFLTIYSALLLVPALLIYLFRVTGSGRRGVAVVAVVLGAALLTASPLLVRNTRLAHNPLYNSHLLDLTQYTTSFPGNGVLGMAIAPRASAQYLGAEGSGEVLAKTARNLTGYGGVSSGIFGLLITPLFLLSALTRFADNRVNRMRALVYVCMACHVVGMAPFQPFADSAPLLLLYAPFAAAVSAGFFLSLIQARNLPAFYAKAMIAGWTTAACVPGIAQLLTTDVGPAPARQVFAYMQNQSADGAALRGSGLYLATDAPEEAAFRLDEPILFLPVDSADMRTVAQRTGRGVGAILLTPDITRRSAHDPYTAPWLTLYGRIIGLSQVTARLNAPLARSVIKDTRLFYPAQLSAGMIDFSPAPFPEQGGAEYSLLFWKRSALSLGTNPGTK